MISAQNCGPHLGCFSFGPEPIQSPDIWSPTIGPQEQTVPAHLVPMDKWSPRQLVPMDKWSPRKLVPLDKQSPNIWSLRMGAVHFIMKKAAVQVIQVNWPS